MSDSHVGVPVPIERFMKLYETIKIQNLKIDPIDAVQVAIDQWVSANSANLVRSTDDQATQEKDGFWWKNVFVPAGSRVRMSYRSRRYDAVSNSQGISFDGATLSPSEFTWAVTSTNRNAWRDIEFSFPGSSEWISADKLRRQADIADLI